MAQTAKVDQKAAQTGEVPRVAPNLGALVTVNDTKGNGQPPEKDKWSSGWRDNISANSLLLSQQLVGWSFVIGGIVLYIISFTHNNVVQSLPPSGEVYTSLVSGFGVLQGKTLFEIAKPGQLNS